MNKAQSKSKLTKVLSLILALVMVLSLMPLMGAASQTASDNTASDSSDSFYRIVHLDCGRKYFTPGWIKALINEMSAAGYNQLQLAFGNKGLRLLLNDMSVTVDGKEYSTENVSNAVNTGNKAYYDAGNKNELTQAEMTEIISYAKSKNIEIVPLFNSPFHMEALITAMTELGASDSSENVYYGTNQACLNLDNSTAVSFVKALMQKYVNYFKNQGCRYFNFGADEYTGGWNDTFYNYAGEIASMITNAGMTPRIFNDSFRTNSTNHVNGVNQVCYWSSNQGYASTKSVYSYANQIINTNQDFYYVVNKNTQQSTWSPDAYYTFSGTYAENTWVNYAKTFSNTQYKNFANYNSDSSSVAPVGSMFCIWCDNPSHKDETQIAKEIRMILRVIGARMQDSNEYSASSVLVDGGFDANGDIYTASSTDDKSTDSGNTGDTTTTVTASENVSVAVGKEYTAETTVSGNVLTEGKTYNVTDGDNTYATYTVKHNAGTEASTTEITSNTLADGDYIIGYVSGNIQKWVVNNKGTLTSTSKPSEATTWKVTNSGASGSGTQLYTIVSTDGYTLYGNVKSGSIDLKASKTSLGDNWLSTWRWSSSSGFSIKESGGKDKTSYYICYTGSDTWSISTNNKHGFAYTKTDATEATTTITFKGAVVTREAVDVTIGNVKYSVTVTEKDLSAEYIYVNYYITNQRVDGSDGYKSIQILASYNDAEKGKINSESGVALSDLVAATGTYTNSDISATASQTVKYYESEYQSGTNAQTNNGWTNKVGTGVTAERVRFYANENGTDVWSVYNGTKWVDVTGTTTTNPETYVTSSSAPSDLAVITAYYLQKTAVTDEVTTYATDWGPVASSQSYSPATYLDFAVKYQSGGNRTPSSFGNSKTIVYNSNAPTTSTDYYWSGNGTSDGRYLKDIFVENNSNYEVYMITVTESTSVTKSSSYSDYTPKITYTTADDNETTNNEQVAWVKSLTDKDYVNSVLYGEDKQYSVFSYGGEPVLKTIEAADNYGYLVTYYLREKNANLHVYYVDADTGVTFNNYGITTSAGVAFSDSIALNKTNWKGNLDNGTVTNIYGKTQTVSADLSTMPAIAAKYRYASDYTCNEIQLKNNNTELYLYYTFSNTKSFVVDFGLPLEIPLSKLSSEYADTTATITSIEVKYNKYGDITVDTINKKFTYTLNTTIDAQDSLTVTVTGVKANSTASDEATDEATYNVNIIPATSVYYEDSFATFTNGSAASWTTVNDGVAQTSTTQALEALGSKTNVYGTDNAYSNSTKYSMGSAHKVTVTSAMAATTGVTWPTATFTFTGTGFDIISLTDNNSGAIYVDVYSGSTATGTPVKRLVVNNYYGYIYDSVAKTWNVSSSDTNNALYQIPVMKVSGLNHGTYTAVITVAYASRQDKTNDSGYSFWLDAIRVYDPIGKDVVTYSQDGEGYPKYIKLHDELVKTTSTTDSTIVDTTTNKVFFIDGAAQANVATYANYGPNNEVYLANGQAITFKINSDSNIASIQIGAKAPSGTANLVVNNEKVQENLSTATEMYYDITSYAKNENQVEISNNGDGILSLTNLKITYKEDPSATTASDSSENPVMLTSLSDEEVNTAVMSVRALFAAPVVETFEPETFEASWNSVRKGQTATLTVKTSEDVESIMVDGVAVTEYTTHTERNGFGWWAEKVTYRVFTYQVTAEESGDHEIIAFNEAGAESDAITATLTVKESGSSWWSNLWNNFFGRWF